MHCEIQWVDGDFLNCLNISWKKGQIPFSYYYSSSSPQKKVERSLFFYFFTWYIKEIFDFDWNWVFFSYSRTLMRLILWGVFEFSRLIFFCRSRQSSIIINSQIYVKVHDFNLETLYANYALKTRLLHAYIILFDANLSRWLDIEVTFWSLIEKKSCKIWFFKLK